MLKYNALKFKYQSSNKIELLDRVDKKSMALKGKTVKTPMRFIAPKCKSLILNLFYMKYFFVTTHSGKFSKVL